MLLFRLSLGPVVAFDVALEETFDVAFKPGILRMKRHICGVGMAI